MIKSKRNKRTQKSQHTRNTDNWKRKENPQKNKAPESQTLQATCQTTETGRAHRFHSTREAKQNKTNKKNQGSPIKTIKSHDSILVPLLGRGVFTAGFAPARPFPTPTYKCVGGSKIAKVSFGGTLFVGWPLFLPCARRSWFFRSLQHPLVPRRPIVHLRPKGPYGSVNSECEPVVHRRAVCGSERLEVVLETIHPILLRASLAWIFPPTSFFPSIISWICHPVLVLVHG